MDAYVIELIILSKSEVVVAAFRLIVIPVTALLHWPITVASLTRMISRFSFNRTVFSSKEYWSVERISEFKASSIYGRKVRLKLE